MGTESTWACATCGGRFQLRDMSPCHNCPSNLCDSCSVLDSLCPNCIEDLNSLACECPGCLSYIELDEEAYPAEDHYCPGAPCRECGFPIKRLAGGLGTPPENCLYRCHVCRIDYTPDEVLKISEGLLELGDLSNGRPITENKP